MLSEIEGAPCLHTDCNTNPEWILAVFFVPPGAKLPEDFDIMTLMSPRFKDKHIVMAKVMGVFCDAHVEKFKSNVDIDALVDICHQEFALECSKNGMYPAIREDARHVFFTKSALEMVAKDQELNMRSGTFEEVVNETLD